MSSLCNNYNTEAKLSSASLAIQTKKAAKSEKLDRSKGIGLILKKKNAQTVKYEISIERKLSLKAVTKPKIPQQKPFKTKIVN